MHTNSCALLSVTFVSAQVACTTNESKDERVVRSLHIELVVVLKWHACRSAFLRQVKCFERRYLHVLAPSLDGMSYNRVNTQFETRRYWTGRYYPPTH